MKDTRSRAYRVISAMAATAAAVAVVAVVHDTQGVAIASESCTAKVNVKLPDNAEQVKLRVLNGTRTTGVAEQVSEDFKNRGFQVQPAVKSKTKVDQIAVVQFGPKTVGAAQWIRAFFLGDAEPQFNPARTSDVIDVVIGSRYRQLATFTEVNQSLAQLGEPTVPPGTCAA
ncbi:LytR C-terminal domain-containing protein [Actinoplanes cyaneus]|nr:LytR C-terminal domain-containing protein [Actinoplanes cyaneus]MCW2140370.1 LytR cell envelope-related transcriptional attenuator [Actinoplanes cyaneus]